eukprot:1194410-Rhodomonas_salina.3
MEGEQWRGGARREDSFWGRRRVCDGPCGTQAVKQRVGSSCCFSRLCQSMPFDVLRAGDGVSRGEEEAEGGGLLTRGRHRQVVSKLRVQEFEKGETIIEEGTEGSSMYIIDEGEVCALPARASFLDPTLTASVEQADVMVKNVKVAAPPCSPWAFSARMQCPELIDSAPPRCLR